MYSIYSISHPLTDDIVYVGFTENLRIRAKRHEAPKYLGDGISAYIEILRSQFLLPKVELIETFEDRKEALHGGI